MLTSAGQTAPLPMTGASHNGPGLAAQQHRRQQQFPPTRSLVWILCLCLGNFWGATELPAQSPESRADDASTEISATEIDLAPPSALLARDHPNDAGTAIDLTWQLSPDDRADRKPRLVLGYQISRTLADGTMRETLDRVTAGVSEFTDRSCEFGTAYLYEVAAFGPGQSVSVTAQLSGPVQPARQWFNRSRAWFGMLTIVVCGSVVFFTEFVKTGRGTYVRPIAGLQAINEAVGRATEMGRPLLFVPGLRDMNEISTVAAINVLSHVARTAAEYDATIEVPTNRSLVMTAARETVHAAYLSAGRPEAFNDDRISYITDEQMAYVAWLTGYMVREQPAGCFYLGIFFAESLILAETGNAIGAIQIAGTSETAQLPFFVAACDYTLIGEELFAASAYLSGEPHQLGSLKGQDAGKVLAGVLLVTGCLLATLAGLFPGSPGLTSTLNYLVNSILGRGGA
ncbi:MAG: hypothetical protein JSS02_19020 [Planctomycetes bacterium]|nr:hypothetical protein [Planctomycetota bacterium]